MKQIILFLAIVYSVTSYSQNITNTQIHTDQQAIDASIDDAIYAMIQPDFSGDALIAKFDLEGQILDEGIFPTDVPNFGRSFAREITANEGKVFAKASTFGDGAGNTSESIVRVPNGLDISTSENRLVAFNSQFSGMWNDEDYLYTMFSATDSNAKLVINNADGTGTSIIPNPGNGSFTRTWLLKIDADDVTNVITIVPVGDTSTRTFAKFNTVDSQVGLKQDIFELDNGNIVIEYTDSAINPGDTYLEIFDPTNLNSIELLGPFDQDVSITDFNEGYALGYYNDERLEFLNTNFQVENETWVFDLVYAPYKMEQFGDILKVATVNSLFPGSETSRMCYFGERVIESHKRGGVTVNWRNYFESFFTSETTTINIANYFGSAFDFNGTPIPAATAGTTHLIIYTTDESGPDNTIAINDNSPDFLEVFQNTKFNPNDPMNLIPDDFDETWITLAPGTTILDDLSFVPDSWLNSIEIPEGFKLAFSENAPMGTDPFAPNGFNRFFTVKIIPNEISSINNGNLTDLVSMRVWITFNSFNSDTVDSDGDGIDDDIDICPNTANGEIVDGDGCSDSQLDDDNDGVTNDIDLCPNTPNGETVDGDGCSDSQLGDDDGDGVMNINDSDPNDPCLPVQSAGYTGFDATSPVWQNADCDGDGETNGEELNCDVTPTDPYDIQDNCASLSIDTFDSSSISLYPNPTDGIVHINSKGAIDAIQVYTLTGQLFYTQNSAAPIDLEFQPSGFYIVRLLTSEGQTFVQQLIKK